jgi:hypothetical protein
VIGCHYGEREPLAHTGGCGRQPHDLVTRATSGS